MSAIVSEPRAYIGDLDEPGLRRDRRWRCASRLLALVPRLALVCALVALANGVVWAIIVPPAQIPDEQAHLSYVEVLAGTHRLPTGAVPAEQAAVGSISTQEQTYLGGVPFAIEGPPSWSPQRDRDLRRRLAEVPKRPGTGINEAGNNPPLYYALAAVPYAATAGLGTIDQTFAVRLLSAMTAAVTAVLVFLFLCELVSTSWLALVGTLVVVLQPVAGFLSGGITPDNLLFLWSAALLLCVARILRRGLTVRRAVALGLVAVLGVLTKGTMYGLLPGAALGVLLAAARLARAGRGKLAVGSMATGALVFAVPFAAWLWANVHVFDRSGSTTSNGVSASQGPAVTVAHWFDYVWQFFLPRLPFMHSMFTSYPQYGAWQVYWRGFVGRFGWFEYNFPEWVNISVFVLLLGIIALAVRALVQRRRSLGRRWAELGTYAVMVLGIVVLINTVGYLATPNSRHNFEQTRYLFPLLPLYGALVAVAVKGAGRRWGPALGALLVVLAFSHTLFAELLTLVRYYA